MMTEEEKIKAYRAEKCGNLECKVSSGIYEGPTFGSGELDDFGFWQFPCAVCARAHEKYFPGDGPCWPFKK